MTITIDASRLLTTTPTGVEVYCQHIIHGLLERDNNLILYTPKLIIDLPKKNQKVLSWPINKLWSQLRLGFELLIHPPDIFFSPGYVIPFLGLLNKTTRKIVTIHDVAFIHLPHSYSRWQKWFLTITTYQAVKFAHKIIVPTQATADDLINYFNCSASKIKVTYFGYDQPSMNNSQPSARKKQILYIGRVEDKKNIDNLIQAFKIFNKKYPAYKLILAGKLGYGYDKNKFSIAGVEYLGYITTSRKEELLKQSSCLVLVSKYEGFGLPLLEGFSYHLPVLASAIPVLKEVGQQACLYVNPQLPQNIAIGLEKITQDNELRKKLIQQGLQRLTIFDWPVCIQQTWKILIN